MDVLFKIFFFLNAESNFLASFDFYFEWRSFEMNVVYIKFDRTFMEHIHWKFIFKSLSEL